MTSKCFLIQIYIIINLEQITDARTVAAMWTIRDIYIIDFKELFLPTERQCY